MDIAGEHRSRAIIFRDQRIAIIEKTPIPLSAAGDPVEPPHRTIFKNSAKAARDPGQPVLIIIAVIGGAVRSEIAVGVIGQAQRARGLILIEAVCGIGAEW